MQLFSNNFKTTLAVDVDSTATSITVASAAGLPVLGVGDTVLVTLESANRLTVEIVEVTAIDGNVLTVVRGKEGIAASAFSAGSFVEVRLTAGWLNSTSSHAEDVRGKMYELHDSQTAVIAGLATAQGSVESSTTPVFAAIPTTQTVMPFTVNAQSSDTDVFEFNDNDNIISFKKTGTYVFSSNVSIKSNVSAARTLSFRLINADTDAVVTEETNVLNIASGNTQIIPLSTLLTVGSSPLNIRVEVVNSGTGYELNYFKSTLVSGVKVYFGSYGDFDSALNLALV